MSRKTLRIMKLGDPIDAYVWPEPRKLCENTFKLYHKLGETDLRLAVGFCPATLSRLSKDLPVSMDILTRICSTLKCDIGDVMAVKPDRKKRK